MKIIFLHIMLVLSIGSMSHASEKLCDDLSCVDGKFNKQHYELTSKIYQRTVKLAKNCKDKKSLKKVLEFSKIVSGVGDEEVISEFIEYEFMNNPICLLSLMKEISPSARKKVANYLSVPTYVPYKEIGPVLDKYEYKYPREYYLIRMGKEVEESISRSGQPKKWIAGLENPKKKIDRLKSKNFKPEYVHYDFSELLMPKNKFIGYIAPNYGRLDITFTDVHKSVANHDTYLVKGYSLVKGNKCDFWGIIKISQIREYEKMHHGVDDKHKNDGIKSQGLLLAEYIFREKDTQKYSGFFEGVMTLFWYLDKDGHIKYDDIQASSDSYKNNQYVGIWRPHGRKGRKTANWGEYRVPFSGDLDIGAGQFGPNPKYFKQGWQAYQ